MRNTSFFSALAVSFLGAGLMAQIPAKPRTTPLNDASLGNLAIDTAIFNGTGVVIEVQALDSVKINDPANPADDRWYCTATINVNGTSSAYGVNAVAGYDLISFIYDAATQTVTPTRDAAGMPRNEVAALNSTLNEFQCDISSDLAAAVADSGAGGPVQARAATRTPTPIVFGGKHVGYGVFPAPTAVTLGSPAGVGFPGTAFPAGYVDPQFGVIRGQNVLFYATTPSAYGGPAWGTGEIYVADYNRATAVITNNRIAVPADAAAIFHHSPENLFAPNGETKALACSVFISGSGSDAVYQPLPERSPGGHNVRGTVHSQGTDWLANPMHFAGTLVYADATAGYIDPLRIDTVLLSGAFVSGAAGGRTPQLLLSPKGTNGIGFLNWQFGFTGSGLDLTPFGPILGLTIVNNFMPGAVSFGLGPVTDTHVIDLLNWPAGSSPGAINTQVIIYDPVNAIVHMSNTAEIEVR
jgi:hypothetical protein